MPIEKENLMLRNVQRPSKPRYEKYVEELNFLGPVARAQERLFRANRKVSPHQMKYIQSDVMLVVLVDHLVRKLRGSWTEALVHRAHQNSELVNPPRSPRPWEMVAKVGCSAEFDLWIKSHLDSKVTWM